MDKATAAEHKINAHEELCLERYDAIKANLTRITKLIGWGGGLLASMIIGLLGWSLNAQFVATGRAIDTLEARSGQVLRYVPAPVPVPAPVTVVPAPAAEVDPNRAPGLYGQ